MIELPWSGSEPHPLGKLLKVPFCLGIINRGYHIFPVVSGTVIEGHRKFGVHERQNVEKAPFNPLQVERNGYDPDRGGGAAGPAWVNNARGLSGLIAIPPNEVF